MSNPIGKYDQLVILVHQEETFTGNSWTGSLEINGNTEYSYSDILVLVNDEPETIGRILKVGKYGKVEDITDAVLDFAENQP